MYAHELFEAGKPNIVVTYPGRFQPFHKGHAGVFEQLQKKFGRDSVFILTSNDQSSPKSPFNFSDKYQLITAAGVTGDRIIETNKMYVLPDNIDPRTTIFITAVGAPDATRLSPDTFLKRDRKDAEGNVIKQAGSPSYYKTWGGPEEPVTADQHGYVIVIPEIKNDVTLDGQTYDVSHGTECRNLWNKVRNDEKARNEFLKALYGKATPELVHIFNKIPEAANEDVDLDSDVSTSPIAEAQLNEFAPDEGHEPRKFIPWTEFIEQLKQVVGKDFDCVENVVKTTIKARFVPHDPMEYGPTMLYSYYETRAGRKGAHSTRGSIQIGKYTSGGFTGQIKGKLLTTFSLLKGHPFERHFDLTFENIYKIANIILGNTQGALEFQPQQQVNEFAPNDGGDNRVPMHFVVEKDRYNRRSKWKKSYKPEGGGIALFTTKQEAMQAAEKYNKLDPNREFAYGGTQMADSDLDEGIFGGLGGSAAGPMLAKGGPGYAGLSGAKKLRHDAHVALQMVDSLKHTNHNGYYDEEIKKKLLHAQECLSKAKELEAQLNEFAPGNGDDDGSNDDQFFKLAKMWYSAPDVETQQKVEQVLAKAGWEIGEIESEEGGAFIVQAGDEDGGSYMGWSEEQLAGLDESRIMDRDALVNVYYVSSKGDRHKVAEKIPYHLVDKLVPLLTKKFAITMKDIEVRPADQTQYRRSSHPELAEGLKSKVAAAALSAAALGGASDANAIAGAFPTPSHQAAMYKAAADSNAAEARRQAELQKKADAERLEKNTEIVDKEQRVNHHLIPKNEDAVVVKKKPKNPLRNLRISEDEDFGDFDRAVAMLKEDKEQVDFPELLKKFLPVAMKTLKLTKLPKISLEKHIETHDGQATFGRYINGENIIHLAIADRHPLDILRTLAHELCHFKQDTLKELTSGSGRTGSPEENEAHVIAGIIMRHFNKAYPTLIKLNPINMK